MRDNLSTSPREASNAGDLLQVFSEIFQEIKPNLQVIPPDTSLSSLDRRVLTLRTRPAQGLRQLFLITTKNGLRSLTLDDVSQTSPEILPDDNISVHLVERSQFPESKWSAATADERSFFVAKTVTYPKVVFPPPSVAGSVTAPHYYPAGKLPLIVAEVVGPAGGERLQYIELNATQRVSQYDPPDAAGALEALNPQRTRFWNLSSSAAERFALEVGQGTGPLRIIRHFQVRGLDVLPRAAVAEPAEGRCDADQPCSLRVGFAPGPEAQDVSAVAYVADEAGTPLFELPMNCTGQECSTEGQQFLPQAGRKYMIRYLVSASSGGVMFGDWAEEPLEMNPRIKISGLPLEIDLCSGQENAWDVKVIADTTEDLGQFRPSLELKRSDTKEAVPEVTVSGGVDIDGLSQPPTMTLRILGAEELPPGIYEGTLTFSTEKAPVGQSVSLPPARTLFCKKTQPVAKVLDTLVAFPDSPYSASPNSTVEVTSSVRVQFAAEPFDLSVSSFASQSCPDLSLVVAGPPEADGAGYTLPLALTSASRIAPKTCEGTVIFSGPSQDYIVEPDKPLTWRLKIPQPELFIKSKTVEFKGPAGLPGDEAHAEILLTYTGSPPFGLAVKDLHASRSDTLVTLADVQVPPSVAETPVSGQDYRVRLEMTPKSNLPTGLYSGKLILGIEGLEGIVADQTLDTRFRSPNFFQRHILPPLERFYQMPAPGLCTAPLTLLAFLFVAAVWRSRSTQPRLEPIPEAPVTTSTVVTPPPPPKRVQPSAKPGPRPGVRPPAPPPKGRTTAPPPRPPRPPAGRPGSQSALRAGTSSARKPIPPSVPRPSGGAKTTAVAPSPARSTSRPPSPPKGKFPGR